jgi:hypothetical protein
MIELMVLSSAEKIIIEVVLVKVGQKVVYWRVEVGASVVGWGIVLSQGCQVLDR